jgi:hypothetical protein
MFLVLISLNDVYFVLIQNFQFFQVIQALSIITNSVAPPFKKVCGNYCLIDIIISPTNDVYFNPSSYMLPLQLMKSLCCWPLKANGWNQLCIWESLCLWLCLIWNKFNSSFPFGFIIDFIDHLHLPLLVFTTTMNNFCPKWNLICVVEIWL